jgi:hypothetical protein
MAGSSEGSFIDSRSWPKKRCFELEARARRRQRLAIEGLAFERIGDARCAQRRLKVAVDDRLSRGSDNAQERGVVAEFPLSGANLLRIILVANLGGLWTNRGDNHVEVAR